MVVFDCMCNTQKFFVIERTHRGWHTSQLRRTIYYTLIYQQIALYCILPSFVVAEQQYSNNQAREGTQNQHKTQQVQQAWFHNPKNFIFSNWRKENKYLPEDGQELTETCRRIF